MGTISDKLEYLAATKDAIKTALVNKGVEVSSSDTFRSYADKINDISCTGETINNQDISVTQNGIYQADEGYTGLGEVTVNVPAQTFSTEELNVTANGTYTPTADGYSKVVVDVAQEGGSGGDEIAGISIGDLLSIDENGMLKQGKNNSFTCTAKNLGNWALYGKYYWLSNITSVNFPNLSKISGNSGLSESFYLAKDLTSINLPELTEIDGYCAMMDAFYRCAVTDVEFPKLTTVSGNYAMQNTFQDCSNLISVSFPSLNTVSGTCAMQGTFQDCSNLTSVSFPKLAIIGSEGMQGAFSRCPKLTSLDLPSLSGEIYSTAFGDNDYLKKVWLPKEVTTLAAAYDLTSTSYYYFYSPFYNCSTNLVIYTDAPSKLEGWSDYCFHVSSSAEATVVYGATHEDFENAEV